MKKLTRKQIAIAAIVVYMIVQFAISSTGLYIAVLSGLKVNRTDDRQARDVAQIAQEKTRQNYVIALLVEAVQQLQERERQRDPDAPPPIQIPPPRPTPKPADLGKANF